MQPGFGKIMAVLAEPIEKISDELTTLINKNINPPEAVAAADVHVRAMFVVSDEINSFGGRFPTDEHLRLSSLLIDSPVLVGHRKDKLPIGRNFHAVLTDKDGRQWVKCYFYWLKSAAGAESLRENIDGGIYKECSIGFTYFFPECSVCGNDIRRCDHQPLQKIVINGVETVTHFNYRKIERVLETSLVYRGALPDTALTKVLDTSAVAPFLNTRENCEIGCRLEKMANSDNAKLIIRNNGRTESFIIRQFNLNRLRHHIRFVAEKAGSPGFILNQSTEQLSNSCLAHGTVVVGNKFQSQYVLKMEGALDGIYILRPVKLERQLQWLFYKLANENEEKSAARHLERVS